MSTEIFAEQDGVDRRGGLCSFGRGDDGELGSAGCVARDEQSRDVGGLVLAGLYGSLGVEDTAQGGGQARAFPLAGDEKHRPAGQRCAVDEPHRGQLPVVGTQLGDAPFLDPDAVAGQPVPVPVVKFVRSVGAQNQIPALILDVIDPAATTLAHLVSR